MQPFGSYSIGVLKSGKKREICWKASDSERGKYWDKRLMGLRYFPWMLALSGLFVLRVLAQLLQAVHPVAFLPPFHAWHGAVLPYPLLVATQVVVMMVLAVICWRVRNDGIHPSRWKYRLCFISGGLYFSIMAFRLFAGLSILADHSWFSKSLPAFFHLVLASFVLMLGHYLYRRASGPTSHADGLATSRM